MKHPRRYAVWKQETQDVRNYYIEYWGFDPKQDKQLLDEDLLKYRYETGYELNNDPQLKSAGVSIWARVDMGPPRKVKYGLWDSRIRYEMDPQNYIVFRRNEREEIIHCIHTAVIQTNLHKSAGFTSFEGFEQLEGSVSTENQPIPLPAEEHFASLKSYVHGIADFGIQTLMTASYHSERVNPFRLPFGFNSNMQQQVVHALVKIAPRATLPLVVDTILYLADSVPHDWFLSRLPYLDNIYNFERVFRTYPETFEIMDEIFNSERFHELGIRYLDDLKSGDTTHKRCEEAF